MHLLLAEVTDNNFFPSTSYIVFKIPNHNYNSYWGHIFHHQRCRQRKQMSIHMHREDVGCHYWEDIPYMCNQGQNKKKPSDFFILTCLGFNDILSLHAGFGTGTQWKSGSLLPREKQKWSSKQIYEIYVV